MNRHPEHAGELVRWHKPNDANEERERFAVIEHNGDRCLIRALGTGLSIPPTQVVLTKELRTVVTAAECTEAVVAEWQSI